ncbi:MAG: 1-deoxy-D-xylulose-5-phosphate synthase [Treponema sp.]|jgi:1-deoxy-D-xylulose-5-phosphate synthase|nr:1-deoxy-D-xylulose-5-phosphate synthase [Treponema sp.]
MDFDEQTPESGSLLAQIRDPKDVKSLSREDLVRLAEELRRAIVAAVSRNGGHLASNLGVVELAIALHRVFNSPEDKIVWDVGHQCYAHKLLTGRFKDFSSLRRMGGLAGFPKRSESPHDVFNTGHASTSMSAALGFLAGERIRGGRGMAVALIGDGALTGGIAYEALSHAGQLGLPLVVILNDNKMSISPNVGGLSKYLSRLSMKAKYQLFRRTFDALVQKIPLVGGSLSNAVLRLKRAVKAVFYTDNFFVDLGFEYVGPIDGHRLPMLIRVLEDVRKLGRPVVIHVITRKGKGYDIAEENPGAYHGVAPPSRAPAAESPREPSFTEAFGAAILAAGKRDRRVTAVTAAMEQGTGLSPFRKTFPERFFDVGIAEEHAVIFAAGLAAQGLKPVTAVYSTFIQRGVDQVIHDVALQRLPEIFALDRAGFVGEDGETHQGIFDIALFRPVPGMTILSPASGAELGLMLEWALARAEEPEAGPVAIRYPKDSCPPEIPAFSLPLVAGQGVWVGGRPGSAGPELAPGRKVTRERICLAFTGGLYREALDAAEGLAGRGIKADLYNLRFLKPVDEDYLAGIMDSYGLTVFAEEGIREGGFGEYAAELSRRRGCGGKLLTLAAPENFTALGTRRELLRANGLDGEGIAGSILEALCSRKDLKAKSGVVSTA